MTSTKFSEGELLELLEANPNYYYNKFAIKVQYFSTLFTIKEFPDCNQFSNPTNCGCEPCKELGPLDIHVYCWDSKYDSSDPEHFYIYDTNDELFSPCDCESCLKENSYV
jgi:hypothetical protein